MAQTLEDIVKKEKRYSKIGFFSSLFLTMTGAYMQASAGAGNMEYNWFTGHLADFSKPAMVSSAFMWVTAGSNKYAEMISVFLPAAIATVHEFYPFTGRELVFDVQDIPLYWLGSGAAYIGIKLLSSENAREMARYAIGKISEIARHTSSGNNPL